MWEFAEKLIAANVNPDQLSHEALAADLTDCLIAGAVLTPGMVGTLPELQRVGFNYTKLAQAMRAAPALLGKGRGIRSWTEAGGPEARHAPGACGKSRIPARYVTKSVPRPNSLHPGERSGTCGVRRWHRSLGDTAPWCSG
jgi:hypothetical protein